MKKVVFLLPGFKHSPYGKIYKNVIEAFETKSIQTVPVKINWQYRTISQISEDFLKEYNKVSADEKYLFGFSFGALISFIIATKMNPKAQILCSLSPYFKEDLPFIFKSWKKMVGKKRMDDFKNISILNLVPQVKTETYLLYGTKEGKFIEKRAKDIFERLRCRKHLVPVEGAKHDISNPLYIQEIRKLISALI